MNKIIIAGIIVVVVVGGAFFMFHQATPQCADGKDNDGDSLVDYGTATSSDPGCIDAKDNDEGNGGSGTGAGSTNLPSGMKDGTQAATAGGSPTIGRNIAVERRQMYVAELNGKNTAEIDAWFQSFDPAAAKSVWVGDELALIGSDKVERVYFTNEGLNILKAGLTGNLDAPSQSKPKVNSISYYNIGALDYTNCESECTAKKASTLILDQILSDSVDFQKDMKSQADVAYGPKPFGTKNILGETDTCYRSEFVGKVLVYTCVDAQNVATLRYTATLDKATGRVSGGALGAFLIVNLLHISPLPSGVNFTPHMAGAAEAALFQL